MDAYEMVEPKQPRKQGRPGFFWNILTCAVLLMTLCIGTMFALVFLNPQLFINPFPPPTAVPTQVTPPTPTPTITPRFQLPPTWTPTPTLEPTITFTPEPRATPLISLTPTPAPTYTATPGPTATKGAFVFSLQQGSPQAIPNIYHQDLGCSWTGVAGQVLTLNGAPVTGLIVQLSGTLGGSVFNTQLSLTGVVREYGPSGFEIQIADKPVDSTNTLYLQLLEPATNLPVSDKIYFSTFNDCQKNLILINFVKKTN